MTQVEWRSIELPRVIDAKRNAFESIPSLISSLRLKGNILMLSSPTSHRLAGKKILDLLEDETSFNVHVLETRVATIEMVRIVKKYVEDHAVMTILAVGGGSITDVAKLASYYSKITFISIPTVLSHDGIASVKASIMSNGYKQSFTAQAPIAVIGDIDLLSQSPAKFTYSGAADLISNLSAIEDWKHASRLRGKDLNNYAIELSRISAESVINNVDILNHSILDRAGIVFRGLMSSSMAMAIAGSSVPASGSEHTISHGLDRALNYQNLHGEQCGLLTIFTMYLQQADWKMVKVILKKLELPTTLADLNIETDIFVEVTESAHLIRDRYTIIGSGIPKEAIIKALKKTGMI